jgi:hypothetical protein
VIELARVDAREPVAADRLRARAAAAVKTFREVDARFGCVDRLAVRYAIPDRANAGGPAGAADG